LYYTFPCPKCGKIMSEYEEQQEGDSDAHLRLSSMVKEHYKTGHEPSELTDTDAELNYKVKTGMQVSGTKPY